MVEGMSVVVNVMLSLNSNECDELIPAYRCTRW